MIDDDLRAAMDRDVASRAAAARVTAARADLWAVEDALAVTMAAVWATPRGTVRRAAARLAEELHLRRAALVEQVAADEELQRVLLAQAETARRRRFTSVPTGALAG